MKNITLDEILRRKIEYIKNNPDNEHADVLEGYILGYSDMREDLGMTESEFTEKYLGKLSSHISMIDDVMDGETVVPDFGKSSGYNSAVAEILSLIDANLMF